MLLCLYIEKNIILIKANLLKEKNENQESFLMNVLLNGKIEEMPQKVRLKSSYLNKDMVQQVLFKFNLRQNILDLWISFKVTGYQSKFISKFTLS